MKRKSYSVSRIYTEHGSKEEAHPHSPYNSSLRKLGRTWGDMGRTGGGKNGGTHQMIIWGGHEVVIWGGHNVVIWGGHNVVIIIWGGHNVVIWGFIMHIMVQMWVGHVETQ